MKSRLDLATMYAGLFLSTTVKTDQGLLSVQWVFRMVGCR